MEPKLKLFDMHSDTAIQLYRTGQDLLENDLQISLKKAEAFDKYVQLAAFFTYPNLTDDEGWDVFIKARENFISQCRKYGIRILKSAEDLADFEKSDEKIAFILAVEDMRIVCGKIERVREMYELGVRVGTLLWGGETIIGGSHNTDVGLTDFGKEVVREMLQVGIVPDISHASFKSTDEIMDICEAAGKSPVATHMNSYTERAHSRNLTDERFVRLTSLGGVAGISLCPEHLTDAPADASVDDAIRHILKYKELCTNGVGFGCDYDGTTPPSDLSDISRLCTVWKQLESNDLTDSEIEQIFYGSVRNFIMKNLPQKALK